MKRVIICILLLMYVVPGTDGTFSEDNPPIFKIGKMVVEDYSALPPSYSSFSNREAGKVVIAILSSDKHLMRVDPIDMCSHFIICTINLKTPKSNTCSQQPDRLIVLPHKSKIAYRSTKSNHKGQDISVQTDQEEKMRIIEISKINTDPSGKPELDVKFPNLKEEQKYLFEFSTDHRIRIETSSFYCNVHIGSIKGASPNIFSQETKTKYESIDIGPLLPGEANKDPRKYFGPLFRNFPFTNDGSKDMKIDDAKKLYTEDKNAQCPFTHEWMGFARWPAAQGDERVYEKNFWKSPVYHYSLKKDGNANCGKPQTSHTVQTDPFQIDIEIDNIFKTTGQTDNLRCFGFALVFGEEFKEEGDETFPLDPQKTFEFYPVSMMFLAPDSEKIRALRVSREALRKIRISFLNKQESSSRGDKMEYVTNFAIVEYGFLNDNIAGVREYIQLPNEDLQNYKSVTLFQEGFCNVRILNVNHLDKKTRRCWEISQCQVLKPN